MPNVSVDGNQLQVVEEIRLLGVFIKSDMRWNSNTENICRNAFSRLWIIKRLKNMGASEIDLLDVYQKQIRCTVEFAVPVWAGSLTQYEMSIIERAQKAALAVIYQQKYENYENALQVSGLKSLKNRRK